MDEKNNAWLAVLLIILLVLSGGTGGVTCTPAPFVAPADKAGAVLLVEETDDRIKYLKTDIPNIMDAQNPGSVRDFVAKNNWDLQKLDVSNQTSVPLNKQWAQDAVAAYIKLGLKPPAILASNSKGKGFSKQLDATSKEADVITALTTLGGTK